MGQIHRLRPLPYSAVRPVLRGRPQRFALRFAQRPDSLHRLRSPPVNSLSTGQNFQSPQEILKFPAEVEGEVTQEVEAMAEEGLEGSLQSFLKGTGEFSS